MTEKRDVYLKKLETKIDEWKAGIDKLAAKADQVTVNLKKEYHKQVADLESKRSALAEKLAALKKDGQIAWKDIKTGVDLAWEAMNQAVKSAQLRFR